MPANDFETIFAGLEKVGARFLVVGGAAVVLHGYLRFTADLDLVVQLESNNARSALTALQQLGYRPRAPVPILDFADAKKREQWIKEKGLTVFSLWSDKHPGTEIDLFVSEPFAFDAAFARAMWVDLPSTRVAVASIDDLIALKRVAGRAKDLEDIAALEALRDDDN
jgi:hypothetical protein